VSDLWLIRTWRKSYPGGRTHLPGWRSIRDQFMPASGSGATHPIRIRPYNKESKVDVAITQPYYETKTRLIDAW